MVKIVLKLYCKFSGFILKLICRPTLMRAPNRLAQRPCFEQSQAEQQCHADAVEYREMDVRARCDCMEQYRVYRDAHHNQKALERKREQAFQVAVADMPPFTVHHRGKRYRCDGAGHINLQHTSVDDDENAERYCFHRERQYRAFNVQPQ